MYNPFSLDGKKLLITGASSGIGRSIAVECSKMGAEIIITARNKERLEESLSLMGNSDRHTMILADLTKDEDISNIIDVIPYKLHGIVHCAGLTIQKPFQFLSKENVDIIMKVNFEAPVFLTQSLLKKKNLETTSSIVFISSISGVFCSFVASSAYSASKGAINGIAKALAIELAVKGIRVNSINPGMIDTNLFEAGLISDEQIAADKLKYPLKRYGNPEEVAYAAIYLLSDASKWVTGSNLVIDGGYTLL